MYSGLTWSSCSRKQPMSVLDLTFESEMPKYPLCCRVLPMLLLSCVADTAETLSIVSWQAGRFYQGESQIILVLSTMHVLRSSA